MRTPPPISFTDRLARILARIENKDRRDDLQQTFDERAGICEHDGGLTRYQAERVAYFQIDRLLRADEKI